MALFKKTSDSIDSVDLSHLFNFDDFYFNEVVVKSLTLKALRTCVIKFNLIIMIIRRINMAALNVGAQEKNGKYEVSVYNYSRTFVDLLK